MSPKEKDKLKAAMSVLEQIPQGGVGESWASIEELNAASENGDYFNDDATAHLVQYAWLLLRELRGEE